MTAVTLGEAVAWVDVGLACLLGFGLRLASDRWLCVSDGWHFGRRRC